MIRYFGARHSHGANRDARSKSIVGLIAPLTFVTLNAATGATYEGALDKGVENYRALIIVDIDQALTGARELRKRLAANDLEGAKKAWLSARGGWERSEVFTSGLVPDLDEKIDTWPKSTAGFHAIEAKLFGAGQMDVTSETDALISDLTEVDQKIRTMPLPPQDLWNGAARLAYEVGESKADGGESRLSGTSLNDMRDNVSGIQQAYHVIFATALASNDPTLAAATQSKIDELRALVDAPSLDVVDADKLRKASEEFVVTLGTAAPKVGLQKPVMEDPSK